MCLAKSPCLGKRCCGQSGIQNGLDAAVPRSLWYAEWAILCTCICCYITCYITSYIRLLYIEIYNMFFKLHTNFAAHPPSPPGSSADACKLETHPRAPPSAQLFAACCFAWCSSSFLLVFDSDTDTFTCKTLCIWNYFFLHFSTSPPPPLPPQSQCGPFGSQRLGPCESQKEGSRLRIHFSRISTSGVSRFSACWSGPWY